MEPGGENKDLGDVGKGGVGAAGKLGEVRELFDEPGGGGGNVGNGAGGNGDGGSGYKSGGKPGVKSGGNAGAGGNNNGENEQGRSGEQIPVRKVETRGRKPKDASKFILDNASGMRKLKKYPARLKRGERPLLTPRQTEQFIDSVFSGAAIIVDTRWAIEKNEATELAQCLYGVLELFPVKLDENPLLLQRFFAIFGLVMVVFAVFTSDDRFAESLKGNNDGLIGKNSRKENETSSGAGATKNASSFIS